MNHTDDHDSVLLKEAINLLCVNPDGFYLDCTGGMGGHSQELRARLSSKGRLWICDYHEETVKTLRERFNNDSRVCVVHSRFSAIFDNLNFPFDGILADFGISSPQLSDAELGIGFSMDGAPLDMRIDSSIEETAADVLKKSSEEELANIFFHFGGERASRKIAAAIVYDRKKGKVYETTDALRDLCSRVLGRYYRNKKIHSATKVFQGLRIAVNKELDEITQLLDQAPARLKCCGRLVLISFHAGEDALVKKRFKELSQTKEFFLPIKKAIQPDREEILQNPRSRSAKMRVLERRDHE